MKRAKKIDTKEIQTLLSNNLILAGDLYIAEGNMNVLLVDDVNEWLKYASYISDALQLLYDFTDPVGTVWTKASLLKKMKPLLKVILYTQDVKRDNQKLTYFNSAFEILENKRVKLDQIPRDELVLPAYVLLLAAENRDYLQNGLGYDLSQYGLPFWCEFDPEAFYDFLENMGPADSFDETESIIWMEVFDDILTITQEIIVNDFGSAAETSKKLKIKNEMSIESNEAFAFWKTKYPVLKGARPSEFRAILLQYYVQHPSRIIELHGNRALCMPYEAQSMAKIIQSGPWSRN